MTQVQYNNKLIAEFMKHEESYDENGVWQKLQYHKDWSWLMPVVEKINKDTDCFVTIWDCQCRIHNVYPYKMESIDVTGATTIDAIYKAVIQFINWHNQNK